MKKFAIALAAVVLFVGTAQAAPVTVYAMGEVVWNAIGEEPLSTVGSGEQVYMTLQVDSDVYDEAIPGDVRAYEITFFNLSFSSGLGLGLVADAPTAYFALVDGFPVSDGFFVSTFPSSPGGVPLLQEPFEFNLDLGYEGDTLASLEILDHLGTYAYDGLTRFGFNIWSIAPDNVALDINFTQLVITSPVPTDDTSWGALKALYR